MVGPNDWAFQKAYDHAVGMLEKNELKCSCSFVGQTPYPLMVHDDMCNIRVAIRNLTEFYSDKAEEYIRDFYDGVDEYRRMKGDYE